MKKYIVNLMVLFGMQNICAMELDPFDRCFEYDDKCKLVAKYLYKYPQGKNDNEAKKIEKFFEVVPERVIVLPWLVKKYKNILETRQAEKYLQVIYKENFPEDVRKQIFRQALLYAANEYYSIHNSLQFLSIYQPEWGGRYNFHMINRFYKPYFLAEVNGENVCMSFSHKDDNGMPEDTIVNSIASLNNTIGKNIVCYHCKVKFIRQLMRFLDIKHERVESFKLMFNNYIEQLSQFNENDRIDGFIFLLKQFKDLTQHTISCYTGKL